MVCVQLIDLGEAALAAASPKESLRLLLTLQKDGAEIFLHGPKTALEGSFAGMSENEGPWKDGELHLMNLFVKTEDRLTTFDVVVICAEQRLMQRRKARATVPERRAGGVSLRITSPRRFASTGRQCVLASGPAKGSELFSVAVAAENSSDPFLFLAPTGAVIVQPRVAAQRLPWVYAPSSSSTPQGLNRGLRNETPLRFWKFSASATQGSRSRQPWAQLL